MSRSWRDYIPKGNTYLNLRVAAAQPFRGITALVGGEPWLVLDYDGKNHQLENQKGERVQIDTPLRWLPSTTESSLIAASRLDESPFKMGSIVDEKPVGHLQYNDGTWSIKHGDGVLPLEGYVLALEAHKWQPLSHEVGERKDEKADPLVCSKCGSHTVEIKNKELHEFRCLTCGNSFQHEVHFNPHNSGKVGYEVDHGEDWKPYAPGPDDPHKRPKTCDNCGYSWKTHHRFYIDNKCPQCGHAQEDVMALEGQSPAKKKAGIHFDQNGKELITGQPYLLKSPRYKIPDVIYVTKADPAQVEAAIESSKGHFPIKIDEKKHKKMMYSFEPFSKNAEALPEFSSPASGMQEPESFWGVNSEIDCPYCGNMISPRDYDENFEEYTCPACRMNFSADELHGQYLASTKEAWDYTQTTDSMGGRDTGAPIRSDLESYDEDIPNPSETAATPASVPPLMHDHLGDDVLYTPRGTVHTLQNAVTGSQILVMSNGEGGVMGWMAGGQVTGGTNWSTTDLLKIQTAIKGGMYAEVPAAGGIPGPANQPPMPMGAPTAKVARKAFSPSEQKELIEENMKGQARNHSKLDLKGTHYEVEVDDNKYLWLW